MRQLVIGIVAAAALISSGVAQARPGENRPSDRPNDYSFGGGRAGSVVAASNPYRSTEAQGIARAQARVMQKTNFHVGRPADSDGAKDFAARESKSMSRSGHGGGMAGSVKSSLNVYRTTEIMGIAHAKERALKKTNQGASQPADSSGADADRASRGMKAMATSGGHGMGGSVKHSLNVYRTAEILGVQSGMRRALQKTNFHASTPADSDGAKDKAAKMMKAEYTSRGSGGGSGAIRYGTNPFFRNEHTAIANGMKRAQSKAGADAPMPKGLGGNTLHPNGTMPVMGRTSLASSIDLRGERTINNPGRDLQP